MTKERRYNVVFIRYSDNAKMMSSDDKNPMTHKEAVTFKSKLMPSPYGHHVLDEAKQDDK